MDEFVSKLPLINDIALSTYSKIEYSESDNQHPNFLLFKVPKNLEKLIFISFTLLVNSIIFNLVILPIKFVVVVYKAITRWSFSSIKLYIYFWKILIMIAGVWFAKYVENSFPMSLIHHRLRNMQGMKIFAFFKFIEVFNNIFNKFNHDFDVQLVKLIRKRSFLKKSLYLGILILAYFIHILSLWSYMIGLSFVLNDTNDFIYMICLKLNFLEFKKSCKNLKKPKVLSIIATDVYDRLTILTSMILVVYQNYYENKINSHNFVNYFSRVLTLLLAEILFDWFKGFVMLKISNFSPFLVKNYYFEIALLHERIKLQSCFSTKERQNDLDVINGGYSREYLNCIQNYEFQIIEASEIIEFSQFLDVDNLSIVKVGSSNLTFCILLISFLIKNSLSAPKISTVILIILISIFLQRINSIMLTDIVLDEFLKNRIVKKKSKKEKRDKQEKNK